MDNILTTKLTELEQIIETGLETFYEVGNALKTIKDEQLWQATYASFDDYCQLRWGFKRSNAYHLISAAEIAQNLPVLPARASHVTPLKTLEPEHQRLAWDEVNLNHNTDNITAKQVEAVATKYRLIEALGAEHWLVRLVNDGVVTAKNSWQVYKILDKLPPYYFEAINRLQMLPYGDVLTKLRQLEYSYRDDILDVLRSGYLVTSKNEIRLDELTVRDLDAWVGRMRYEAIANQQLIATEKQKMGLPIFDGDQVFDLAGDLVYLFPGDYVKPVQLAQTLEKQGYGVFMLVAHKNNPQVNFGGNQRVYVSQVNGVKPQPVMELVKTL